MRKRRLAAETAAELNTRMWQSQRMRRSTPKRQLHLLADGNWGQRKVTKHTRNSLALLAKKIGELSAEILYLMSPFGNWTIEPAITREIQAFRANNLPPLPMPKFPQLPPPSLQE